MSLALWLEDELMATFEDYPTTKMPEHTWAPLVLGRDMFGGGNRKHTVIRKIIIEYIALTPMRMKIMLLLAVSLTTLNVRRWWYFGAALCVLAVIYVGTQGRIYTRHAAVLWATFRYGRDISDSEIENIVWRFESVDWINRRVNKGGCLLNLIIAALLIYFWGIMKGGGLFLVCFAFTTLVANAAHAYQIGAFRRELKNRTPELLSEYEERWLGNPLLESDIPVFRNKHFIVSAYLLVLILIKIKFPENIAFNAYLFVVLMGSMVSLWFSESLRSKVTTPSRFLRKPRAPYLSRILSLHIVHSFVFDMVWLSVTLMVMFSVTRGTPFLVYCIAAVFLVPICRFYLANGTIRLSKWVLDYKFNVIIFRRFSPEFVSTTRTLIAPTFGAYGRVISIWDNTLDEAKAGVNADSESLLGEHDEMLICGDNWQRRVLFELRNADLAVFHWEVLPTANMEWEFSCALEFISFDRLIFVCHADGVEQIKEWIKEKTAGREQMPKFILVNRDTRYMEFSARVYELLRELESTRRPMIERTRIKKVVSAVNDCPQSLPEF